MVRYKKKVEALLDVYTIKFEALLVIKSSFVVDIDASSLNIKITVHNFRTIITISKRNYAQQNENRRLFLGQSVTSIFKNKLFVQQGLDSKSLQFCMFKLT